MSLQIARPQVVTKLDPESLASPGRLQQAAGGPSFTRASPPTDHGSRIRGAEREEAKADGVSRPHRFSSAQLHSMGTEIQARYAQKVVGQNSRYLVYDAAALGKIRIAGVNANALLIHSKYGIIQLDPDGMPRSHRINRFDDKRKMDSVLMSVLATLRYSNIGPHGIIKDPVK